MNLSCDAGHPGSTPGLRRSPGEGNGNPLQYFCLENLMDRGAWQTTVHEVARVGHDLATKPPTTIHIYIYIPQKLMLSFTRYPFKKPNTPAFWNCPPLSLLLSSYSHPYHLQNEYLNFLHHKLVLPWYKSCLGII